MKLKHSLVDISHLFVPAGPAPVPSPTLFSPPRRRAPSTPPNRSRGRRRRRDITPPTPSSTRTLNCSGSSSVLDAHVHWLFPHSPFRHVLHKNSAAHLELTSAFILLLYYWVWKGGGVGVGCLFFAWREVEQPAPSLWREGNLMSSTLLFLLVRAALEARTWAGAGRFFSCLCNSSVCAQQLKLLATSFTLTETSIKNPQMRFNTSVPAVFKAPNISSYKQQMLYIYYYILHI